MENGAKQIGNLFEYFITCGIKNMEQDSIIQGIQKPLKKELGILTMYPSMLDRKFSPNLDEFAHWCFPQGLKVLKQGDPKFQRIEDYYFGDDDRNISLISDINYFVITDLATRSFLYCTSAIFYEKMFLIDTDEKLIQVYIPKAFSVISKFPAFVPQRSFLIQLLKIQKMRLTKESRSGAEKLISVTKNNKEYQIEETKLYDFYIRTAMTKCPILQLSCEVRLNFSSSDTWINYYLRNNLLEGHFSIFTLSNNLFDVLIFNQPLYSLYKLLLYMMLEFQIIIVSRKPAGITLFCQSLIELLKPMEWKGIYMPFLRVNNFDFQKTKIPYLIGIDRNLYDINDKPLPKELRRIIYDMDDCRFVGKSEEIKCPKMLQNYLIRKLNFVFAELKFYENEYFEEGVLRFRQCFYNFILLMLNDIQKYFSNEQQADEKQKPMQIENQNEKKVVYFNYRKFLSSFDQADQPFFLQFIKTMLFSSFVRELYKAIEYRDEYATTQSEKQLDYNFTAVLQFFDDLRFLSIRFGEQTLDDKFTILENLQNNYIRDVLERGRPKSKVKLVESMTTDFIPEYMENVRGNSLNLSTEMKSMAQRVERQDSSHLSKQNSIPAVAQSQGGSKVHEKSAHKSQEPSIGGREVSVHSHRSDEQKDFSQMTSKLSNGEIQSLKRSHQSLEFAANNPRSNIRQHSLDEHQWDGGSIVSSHISQVNDTYQIHHLNLLEKKNAFKRMLASTHEIGSSQEIEDDEVPSERNKDYLIVTNIGEKNMLQIIGGQQQHDVANHSLAGKSYFNKSFFSLNPLVGDDNTPEIHHKTLLLMARNQELI